MYIISVGLLKIIWSSSKICLNFKAHLLETLKIMVRPFRRNKNAIFFKSSGKFILIFYNVFRNGTFNTLHQKKVQCTHPQKKDNRNSRLSFFLWGT